MEMEERYAAFVLCIIHVKVGKLLYVIASVHLISPIILPDTEK